jgi:hypothetical protein
MKPLCVYILLLFVLVSETFSYCKPASSVSDGIKNTVPGDTLSTGKTFTVTGIVTQTFSYCGGAAPPKQILDKLKTPVAYPGKKFYVRSGKVNNIEAKIVGSFTTDSIGRFSVSLQSGAYSIIQEEQLNKIRASDYDKQNQEVDEQCLMEWWAKPYYILEIRDNNISGLNFNFQHTCFVSADIPCLKYVGPPVP